MTDALVKARGCDGFGAMENPRRHVKLNVEQLYWRRMLTEVTVSRVSFVSDTATSPRERERVRVKQVLKSSIKKVGPDMACYAFYFSFFY